MVIGYGMVGARFIEEVRRRDPNGVRVRLTVLGAEPWPASNRVLLSTVLAGGLSARSVELHPIGWAARQRVDLRTGVSVSVLPGAATEAVDPGHLPAAAVVCRCNTVTKGALVTAWRAGATDPGALSRATRAGTGCGSCGDTVRGICAWLAESDPPVLHAVGTEGAA